MSALPFIDLPNIAEFVITTRSFQESTTIIANSGLTQFKLEKGFPVIYGILQQCSTIIVCFGLDMIFVLQEKTDNANIDT